MTNVANGRLPQSVLVAQGLHINLLQWLTNVGNARDSYRQGSLPMAPPTTPNAGAAPADVSYNINVTAQGPRFVGATASTKVRLAFGGEWHVPAAQRWPVR